MRRGVFYLCIRLVERKDMVSGGFVYIKMSEYLGVRKFSRVEKLRGRDMMKRRSGI